MDVASCDGSVVCTLTNEAPITHGAIEYGRLHVLGPFEHVHRNRCGRGGDGLGGSVRWQ
jgi:hypothetical protein